MARIIGCVEDTKSKPVESEKVKTESEKPVEKKKEKD